MFEKESDEVMERLRKEFEEAMLKIDAEGKLFDCSLKAMTLMIEEHHGVETARILIMNPYDPCEKDGLGKLAKSGGLKFSVEWLVARTPKFHPLFVHYREGIIEMAEAKIEICLSRHPDQKDEPPIKHKH